MNNIVLVINFILVIYIGLPDIGKRYIGSPLIVLIASRYNSRGWGSHGSPGLRVPYNKIYFFSILLNKVNGINKCKL